jgi:uncharacterized membrane protein YgaE (UPF0421/DUF939 family)
MYFGNLTFWIIVFYAIISTLISGTISLIIKLTNDWTLKKNVKIEKIFIGLSIAILLIFIFLIVTDKPYDGGRVSGKKHSCQQNVYAMRGFGVGIKSIFLI